jgi:hypothetical protein
VVSSAWSEKVENLKKSFEKLEKIEEGTQTNDSTQARCTDKTEIGYKKGLYIKTKDKFIRKLGETRK